MFKRFGSLVAVSTLLFTSASASPITVLGLPLGGKVKYPIRTCSPSEIGSPSVNSMCWVGSPSAYKKVRLGSVAVPGADTRPKWAGNALLDIAVNVDGTLDWIKVRTLTSGAWPIIHDSITRRFGPATATHTGTRATWVKEEIYIDLLCSGTDCWTEFRSPESYAQWQLELEARKRRDATRSPTP